MKDTSKSKRKLKSSFKESTLSPMKIVSIDASPVCIYSISYIPEKAARNIFTQYWLYSLQGNFFKKMIFKSCPHPSLLFPFRLYCYGKGKKNIVDLKDI